MINDTALFPSRRRLAGDSATTRTRLAMADKELMQRILEMIRDPHLQMTECCDFCDFGFGFARGQPAEPFADAEDVGVDGEAGTLETEEDHAGGGLGPDSWVLD